MALRRLSLANFRNFSKEEVDFSNLVVFWGGNATGKTNLLEAIYFLAFGYSFREKDILRLISEGENFSRILGIIEDQKRKDIEAILKRKNNSSEKILKVSGNKKRPSLFLGNFSVVLFTPQDLNLILGPPYLRRRYFNLVIGQVDPTYRVALFKFKRVLETRNRLLFSFKEGKAKERELDFWTTELVEKGSFITQRRKEVLNFFSQWVPPAYQKLSGERKAFQLLYQPKVKGETLGDIQKNYQVLLEQNKEEEIKAGFSLFGPHRDDFLFLGEGRPLSFFGSRGEIRTTTLALKFIELKFLEEQGKKPTLLLDDVFSELDTKRRDFLCSLFPRQQTIVATTDLDHIKPSFREEAEIIKIENGQFKE